MKSIRIATFAVPLLSACQLLNWAEHPAPLVPEAAGVPETVAVAPAASAAQSSGDPVQLRPAPALAAEPLLLREQVKAETRFGDSQFASRQAQALAGDANAAMDIATMYAEGSHGVPRDERSMVLWLKHASLLDHSGASYQLYLYYLARGLDREAVRYERRAVRQGYTIPVRLDNRRG